jgi:hypothetical protein
MIEAITRVLANVDNIRLSPVRESRLRFHGLCPFVYRLLQFAKSAPHETHNYDNYQYKPLPMKHLRKNSGPLLGWQRPGFVPFCVNPLYLAERDDSLTSGMPGTTLPMQSTGLSGVMLAGQCEP